MARKIKRLEAHEVPKITEEGLHADGDGLYLRVTDGTKSWIFRYVRGGKEHKIGLGPVRDITLANARKKALEMRLMLREGVDPLELKRSRQAFGVALAARNVMTFDKACTEYIATFEKSWSNRKHRNQWESTLKQFASPVIGHLPVADIDTAKVMEVLKPIWGSTTETANRLRGRIEAVLDWCKVQGYRPEGQNPAAWKGHLKHMLPAKRRLKKVKPHPTIEYTDAGALMAELRAIDTVKSAALQFLLLCASRTEEVLGATWPEFDLRQGVWTVPAERMKSRREHRVPLSPAAIAVIEKMSEVRSRDEVFPVTRIDILLQQLRPGKTVHGLRATFRTWASEQTAYPRELCETALGHVVGDETERAYQRGDLLEKRRKLMETWATYLDDVHKSGDILPLRKMN